MQLNWERYYNCFDGTHGPIPKIGSLIRVSITDRSRRATPSFPNKAGTRWVNVEDGTLLLFLGTGEIDITDYLHGTCETVVRYYFLVNDEIIFSVEPGRSSRDRSFNWELIPCEQNIHTEPNNNL